MKHWIQRRYVTATSALLAVAAVASTALGAAEPSAGKSTGS